MIVRTRMNASTAMRIGMAALVAALLWPRLIHPPNGMSLSAIDGIHGFLFGIAIGMNLLSVRLSTREACGEGR